MLCAVYECSLFASGSSSGVVHLWTVSSSSVADPSDRAGTSHLPAQLNVVHLCHLTGNSRCCVTAMDFSQQEALLGVGYEDGTVRVWDLQVIKPCFVHSTAWPNLC